jgi:hypothetical protein
MTKEEIYEAVIAEKDKEIEEHKVALKLIEEGFENCLKFKNERIESLNKQLSDLTLLIGEERAEISEKEIEAKLRKVFNCEYSNFGQTVKLMELNKILPTIVNSIMDIVGCKPFAVSKNLQDKMDLLTRSFSAARAEEDVMLTDLSRQWEEIKTVFSKEGEEDKKPEKYVLVKINNMCIQSLAPDTMEMWDKVRAELINNRKDLNEDLHKLL